MVDIYNLFLYDKGARGNLYRRLNQMNGVLSHEVENKGVCSITKYKRGAVGIRCFFAAIFRKF